MSVRCTEIGHAVARTHQDRRLPLNGISGQLPINRYLDHHVGIVRHLPALHHVLPLPTIPKSFEFPRYGTPCLQASNLAPDPHPAHLRHCRKRGRSTGIAGHPRNPTNKRSPHSLSAACEEIPHKCVESELSGPVDICGLDAERGKPPLVGRGGAVVLVLGCWHACGGDTQWGSGQQHNGEGDTQLPTVVSHGKILVVWDPAVN